MDFLQDVACRFARDYFYHVASVFPDDDSELELLSDEYSHELANVFIQSLGLSFPKTVLIHLAYVDSFALVSYTAANTFELYQPFHDSDTDVFVLFKSTLVLDSIGMMKSHISGTTVYVGFVTPSAPDAVEVLVQEFGEHGDANVSSVRVISEEYVDLLCLEGDDLDHDDEDDEDNEYPDFFHNTAKNDDGYEN